jgi:hypothetical protein
MYATGRELHQSHEAPPSLGLGTWHNDACLIRILQTNVRIVALAQPRDTTLGGRPAP